MLKAASSTCGPFHRAKLESKPLNAYINGFGIGLRSHTAFCSGVAVHVHWHAVAIFPFGDTLLEIEVCW